MKKTIKYHDRAEWLAQRQQGIGASEVGTILGLNPFETPYRLWRRKKGLDAPQPENEAMLMGHLLEDAVAQRFALATGVHIIKSTTDDFTVYNTDRPYMRVSPDRYYWPKGVRRNEANKCVLECKTTALPVDADAVPKHWFCQIMYQLGVCEYQYGSLAWIYLGHREFGMLPVEFDKEFFEYMVGQVDEFWERYIVGDEEPVAYTSADVKLKYPRHTVGKSVRAEDGLDKTCELLREANESFRQAKERKEYLEDIIKAAMGDAESLVTPDDEERVLATWKAPKPSSKLNTQRLHREMPELYDQYCEDSQGARRFMLK